MASAFGHGFAGAMLGKSFFTKKLPRRFWILSVACSILPDADALGHVLGVPYQSVWGHRGITHSIFFAVLIGASVPRMFFKAQIASKQITLVRLAFYFFIVTLSHSVLDGLTNGGLGLAYFAPFDNSRYFLPWRPILVSPIGVTSFFNARGLRVIGSEALWIGVPSILLWVFSTLIRRAFSQKER
jgi:inner membrane protein